MTSDDIFSVTDLRNKPKLILERSEKRPQFIFKNNKMVGVLISPKEYDMQYWTKEKIILHEIGYGNLSANEKKMFSESDLMDRKDFSTYTLENYED